MVDMSEARQNEQAKLFATALNSLGVGAIITALVAPAVVGHVGDWAHTATWLIFGWCLIGLAQLTLWRFHS